MPQPAAGLNIMLVPGFGASSLVKQGMVGARTRVWYTPQALLRYGPEAITLASDGVSPVITPPGPLVAGTPDTFGLYTQLGQQLASDGWIAQQWAYDWRLDLSATAYQLAAYLARQYTRGPFYVLCHSMGGLIAQLAYPIWAGLDTEAEWVRTTYLATPHGGCYWGPAALGQYTAPGWEAYVYWLLAYGALVNPGGITAPGGPLHAAITAMIASWPSVYEVGPNAGGPWAALDRNAPLALQPSAYASADSPISGAYLTAAAALQKQLVTNLTATRPPELCLAGTGTPTIVGVQNPANFFAPEGYILSAQGDGTVPLGRALIPSSEQITGTWSHNGILSDAGVLSSLTSWMLAPPVTAVSVTPPLIQAASPLPAIPPNSTIPITGFTPPGPSGVNRTGGLDP
jgi:hypothetical protein